jgi:quinone-modifying oxidoreductase subunit QmoC
MKKGRVNELKMGLSMYFKDGFGQGIKNALANQKLGQNMMKAKRMNAMEFFGGHGVKSPGDLQKIIKKAQEIEDGNYQDFS